MLQIPVFSDLDIMTNDAFFFFLLQLTLSDYGFCEHFHSNPLPDLHNSKAMSRIVCGTNQTWPSQAHTA